MIAIQVIYICRCVKSFIYYGEINNNTYYLVNILLIKFLYYSFINKIN